MEYESQPGDQPKFWRHMTPHAFSDTNSTAYQPYCVCIYAMRALNPPLSRLTSLLLRFAEFSTNVENTLKPFRILYVRKNA